MDVAVAAGAEDYQDAGEEWHLTTPSDVLGVDRRGAREGRDQGQVEPARLRAQGKEAARRARRAGGAQPRRDARRPRRRAERLRGLRHLRRGAREPRERELSEDDDRARARSGHAPLRVGRRRAQGHAARSRGPRDRAHRRDGGHRGSARRHRAGSGRGARACTGPTEASVEAISSRRTPRPRPSWATRAAWRCSCARARASRCTSTLRRG